MCGHKTCDVIRERKYPEGKQKGTMHSACGNVPHVALYGGSLRWNSFAEVVCGYLEYLQIRVLKERILYNIYRTFI